MLLATRDHAVQVRIDHGLFSSIMKSATSTIGGMNNKDQSLINRDL
jgi:hypothetical protein